LDLAADAEIGAEVRAVRVGHADLAVLTAEDDHAPPEVGDGGRLPHLDLGREGDDEPTSGITMRLRLFEKMAHLRSSSCSSRALYTPRQALQGCWIETGSRKGKTEHVPFSCWGMAMTYRGTARSHP